MSGFAVYDLKYGFFRLEYEDDVITRLKRMQEAPMDFGSRTNLTDTVAAQLAEYFDEKRKSFDFPYRADGTAFQKKVWAELCRIPYGETRAYKEIAEAIGNPKASRAVGMANNRNPITLAIPCHRVIGANGKLVGYAGGLPMKKAVLNMEAKNK